jgi:hypothetical protein
MNHKERRMTTQHVDLPQAVWQKSSYSGGTGGQWVEVARNLWHRDSARLQGP